MPKKTKPAPRNVNAADAVFSYFSICCNALAKKAACVIARGQNVGIFLGAKPEGEATLGSWRCGACGKPASVTRVKNEKVVVAS